MPVRQWINARGETVRVFATDEPFRFRVEVDDKPFDPNTFFDKMKGA